MGSIWEHTSIYNRSCEERSSGTAPEMDCARQLAELLDPRVRPGMTLLDVGCGAGHYWHSLKRLGIEYSGIDSSPTAIEIGKRNLPRFGVSASRLRHMRLEELPAEERYDAVVCFNTLMYCPNYHEPLDAMVQAARRWILIRDSFEEKTRYRWEADILLDEGWKHVHAYYNVWGRDEIRKFLESRGFRVEFIEDRRRKAKFEGACEVVGGIPFPYEILIAERAVKK